MTTHSTRTRWKLPLGLFLALAGTMSGCPKEWQHGRLDGTEGTAFIAGVFYDFMAIGQNWVEVPEAEKDKAHLYVARFAGNGEAKWMRSFGPLAASREVSFLSDKDQIMVAGVVTERLKIEETRFHVLPRSGYAQALFFTSFDQNGRTRNATLLAAATEISKVQIRRAGKGLEVIAKLRGGVTVPGQGPLPDNGQAIRLEITPEGQVLKAQVVLPKPTLPAGPGVSPNYGKGAKLDRPGATTGGPMLASMMMLGCDYCAWNDQPRWDPGCVDCRTEICTKNSSPTANDKKGWCCWVNWTPICMREAKARCPSSDFCGCQHNTCSTSAGTTPMQSFCTTDNRGACVATVVGRDATCSTNDWHSGCRTDATNLCSPACP
jgi:hypothetical protein